MQTTVKYGLPPLTGGEPRILVLGSLPSDISIETQEYYANDRNLFWKIIASVSNSPLPYSYEMKKALLAKNNIALWDIYTSADRAGSLDSNIKNGKFNDIAGFVDGHPTITTVIFNGNKAFESFKKYLRQESQSNRDVLRQKNYCQCPSTSPLILTTGLTFDDVINEWRTAISGE